jgi:hypothetical protein
MVIYIRFTAAAFSLLFIAVTDLLLTTTAHAEMPDCAKPANLSGRVVLQDQPAPISMTVDSSDQISVSTTILIDDGSNIYCIADNFFSESGVEPPPQGQKLAEEGRRRIQWFPPYLLVRSQTEGHGGAYDSTWIFKASSDGKLKRLGAIGGDADTSASGQFLSLFNKASVWTGEAFFCIACKPNVRLVIEDTGGTLVANPEATWEANQKEWHDNEAFISSQIQTGPPKDHDPDAQDRWLTETLGAVTENAVIAKYCGHDAEVVRLTALAKDHLDQASMEQLKTSLQNVIALELPDRWNAVWSD